MSLLHLLALRQRPLDQAEERLVTAAQTGDRRAFDMLARNHEKVLRGFLMRRVGVDAVDDLMQETWMAAWTALPKFTRRSRLKAWLFGIAQHKVRDLYRAQGRAPVESLSDHETVLDSLQHDPYGAIDLKHAIQSVLTKLPDAQREVLEMYYYAELTLPEISEALGRNENTVKYQFYRAHALVAGSLGPA